MIIFREGGVGVPLHGEFRKMIKFLNLSLLYHKILKNVRKLTIWSKLDIKMSQFIMKIGRVGRKALVQKLSFVHIRVLM